MSIFSILLVWLLLAIILGCKKPALALPFLVSLQLLIPPTIKFNIGINLNIFNLFVTAFILLSLHSVKRNSSAIPKIEFYLKFYMFYVFLYSFFVYLGTYSIGEYLKNMIVFFLEYIGVAYCINYIRFDDKSIKFFNAIIMVSASIIIVYGIFNYIVKINPYMMYISMIADLDIDMSNVFMGEQRGFLEGRISSTFSHPLYLGQGALLLFSYLLYEWIGRGYRFLYLIILIGLIAMVILCGSRSAIIPLVICIFFYVRNIKIRKNILYVIVFLLACMCIFSNLPKNAQKTIKAMIFVWDEEITSDADFSGSSIELRREQLDASLKIIEDNIWFGNGNGYVSKHGKKHTEMLGYESFVLKELVDGGILGVFSYVFFYVLIYIALLKKTNTKMERSRIHSLCCSFFISILFTGATYSFFSLYITLCFISYYSILNNRKKNICTH